MKTYISIRLMTITVTKAVIPFIKQTCFVMTVILLHLFVRTKLVQQLFCFYDHLNTGSSKNYPEGRVFEFLNWNETLFSTEEIYSRLRQWVFADPQAHPRKFGNINGIITPHMNWQMLWGQRCSGDLFFRVCTWRWRRMWFCWTTTCILSAFIVST